MESYSFQAAQWLLSPMETENMLKRRRESDTYLLFNIFFIILPFQVFLLYEHYRNRMFIPVFQLMKASVLTESFGFTSLYTLSLFTQ
jgi:hypothetical protein